MASRNSLSNLKRFSRFCRVGVVDRDVEEEGVDGGAQGGQGAHRALEILLVHALAHRHAGGGDGVGEVYLRDRERRSSGSCLPAKASAPSFFSSARRMLAARR